MEIRFWDFMDFLDFEIIIYDMPPCLSWFGSGPELGGCEGLRLRECSAGGVLIPDRCFLEAL